jgi:hypothetical protein
VIFGAGSLTHWLIRLLRYANSRIQDRIHIIVTSDDWEGLKISKRLGAEDVILLDENCHEEVLVERLRGSIRHGIQMTVCLTQDDRSQKRAVQCLGEEGVLVIPEFSFVESELSKIKHLEVVEVPRGTVVCRIQWKTLPQLQFGLIFYDFVIFRKFCELL